MSDHGEQKAQATLPAPTKWQRNAAKDGWFKLGQAGLVNVSDEALRAFEKTNHETLRGVNAQGRLDRLVAARIPADCCDATSSTGATA